MKKSLFLIVLGIVSAVFMVFLALPLLNPPKDMSPEERLIMEKALGTLHLSKEQIQKLKEIRRDHDLKVKQELQNNQSVLDSFNSLVHDPDASEEKIRLAHQDIVSMNRRQMESKLDFMMEVRSVLNREQREKFLKAHEEVMRKQRPTF